MGWGCPPYPPPPTVTFNYATWIGRYPEFNNISPIMAQAYWDEAGLYFANMGWTAALPSAPTLLNMLTAHIAWLYSPRDADGNPSSTGAEASPLVGRISTASEGSVSVSTELNASGSPSESFFTQTKYGLSYWAATARFRLARYLPGPRRNVTVPGLYPAWPYGGRGGGW